MENFRNSFIDNIIGPEKQKNGLIFLLDKMGLEKIDNEIEKTLRDKELINFTQKCLDEFLESFGKKNIYNVPDEKIHLVRVGGVKDFTRGEIDRGVANVQFGSCIIDRDLNEITYVITIFHELYHLKTFTSVQIDDDGYFDYRRSGFGINVKNKEYFGLINETLNDYACKQFFEEKIKKSNLFKNDEVDKYVFESTRMKLLNLFEEKAEELLEKNKDRFNSKEEIKKLFFDADINGNLLPIARLIEKTYGKGSFRKIGEQFKKK